MTTIDEDDIRTRAYQLWEEGGCLDGNHEEHWRRAQAECGGAGRDGAGVIDGVEGPTTLAGLDDGSTAVASGIDGEISRPLIDVKSKPQRWPTPIVDV